MTSPLRLWPLLAILAAPHPGLPQESAPARPKDDAAIALLRKYCFDCHADDTKKGDLALDALLQNPRGAAEWLKAWKLVRHEFMPPAGKARPTAEERRILVDWVAGAKLGVDFDAPDPGRVTIRRLNRMEYESSVQDLFGIRVS